MKITESNEEHEQGGKQDLTQISFRKRQSADRIKVSNAQNKK